jgi:serine/threonine protein kinase
MGYMAPEQFNDAKSVGFTADLYAIGVVIFRTLTGRLPFVSRSLEAVIKMKAEQVAPSISGMPDMPKNVLLDWFVKKTMARDAADRFQTAREMLEHWWNVMASLDEDGATDVMRGIGRVDESYAGPLRREDDAEEDRTVRRRAPVAPPTMEAAPVSSQGEVTVLDVVPSTVPGLAEDLFDIPTRSDPNLRRLVEQELELQRKRRPPPSK